MATISSVNGKKITKIKVNSEIFDVGGGSDFNLLQYIIDNHKGDGQPSGDYLFYEYWGSSLDDAISSCDFSGIISAKEMFYDCKNLTSVPYFNTSSCTSMYRMFYQCKKLTTIPQFNTSNVTNMEFMVAYCSNLTTIPQLDLSNVTQMGNMFYACENLENDINFVLSNVDDLNNAFNNCVKIKNIHLSDTQKATDFSNTFAYCKSLLSISPLNTNKTTRISGMFRDCYLLTAIDLTHMKITSAYYSQEFAYNCYSLTKLIIRNMDTIPTLNSNAFNNCYHFTGTTSPTYNPDGLKDGRIYVPDDKVEELKVATNWSVYADIIVPLSTLVE